MGEILVLTGDHFVGAPVERADAGDQALRRSRRTSSASEGAGLIVGTHGDYQADDATLRSSPSDLAAAASLQAHVGFWVALSSSVELGPVAQPTGDWQAVRLKRIHGGVPDSVDRERITHQRFGVG